MAAPLLVVAAILAAFCVSLLVGSTYFPPDQIIATLFQAPVIAGWVSIPAPIQTIIWEIRLPRSILVMLVGMALGCSGGAYQGIFRNPLADPYLLGIGSGASLGAVSAIVLGLPPLVAGLSPIPLFAFLGALGTVILVHRIAGGGREEGTRLILAGVAVGAFANSVATLLMLRSRGDLQRTMTWLLGGFSSAGWQPVWWTLPYVILGIAALALLGRALNALQFGDEQAVSAGLDAGKARNALILSASILTAAAVSFSGVIGFIGLAVPHMARLLWGPDYRKLLPLAAVLGGIVLLTADMLARVLLSPQELPVGVITALFGVPFFIYLLRRSQSAGQ